MIQSRKFGFLLIAEYESCLYVESECVMTNTIHCTLREGNKRMTAHLPARCCQP